MVSLTDPNGNVTTSTYDAARRLTTVTAPPAPLALVTTYGYDPDGRLLQTRQSAAGAVLATTSAAYTPSGKLATATDANGNVTRYAYDAADRLARVADPAGRITTYAYDAMSRRTATFNPAIQSAPLLALGYTPDGLLASLGDANGNTTGYAYDGLDRLAATTYPDSSTESYSYDANSNTLSRKTRRGDTISYTYDTLNRLATKAAPGEATVSYGWDLAGRITSVSDFSAAIAVPSTTPSYSGHDQLGRDEPAGQGELEPGRHADRTHGERGHLRPRLRPDQPPHQPDRDRQQLVVLSGGHRRQHRLHRQQPEPIHRRWLGASDL